MPVSNIDVIDAASVTRNVSTLPALGQTTKSGSLPFTLATDDAVIGAVTASPTANTLLARLKDILSLTVLAVGTNIIGKVGIDQTTPGTTDSVTVKASEAHLGEVGTSQLTVQVAQTVTAAAYATGNSIGGKITIANAARVSAGSGLLQSIVANMKTAQSTQIDVFIFGADPTSSTITDKTAFVLHASDFDKVLGVVHITDWTAGNTASVGQTQNLAIPFALASGTSLYAAAVTRATPTYGSTSDVSFGFRVLRN